MDAVKFYLGESEKKIYGNFYGGKNDIISSAHHLEGRKEFVYR